MHYYYTTNEVLVSRVAATEVEGVVMKHGDDYFSNGGNCELSLGENKGEGHERSSH